MIKNLLFDLGGVIVDIERQRCVEAFERLGLADASSYFGDYAQTGVFMQVEDGSITPGEFHRYLKQRLPAGTTDAQIDEAFQRFIIGIPAQRLSHLRGLRQRGLGIYLLSNTNPIMWNGVLAESFRQEGLERADYFDGMVTSFEAGCAKPDPAIFRKVVSDCHIEPGQTLFLDDSQANVEAARALGFQAAHVVPGTEFIDYIEKLL